MVKAFLFDMDGVLYDSMPAHVQAWHETVLSLGMNSNPDDYYLFEGMTGAATIDIFFNRAYGHDATEEEKQRIYAQKSKRFVELNPIPRPMPGAREVLEAVKKRKLKRVVVTGSGQPTLYDSLDKDFLHCFEKDLMVTGYDVKFGKPHPEPYLLGLEKAGVKADEAITVENAPLGVRSAVAAGIYTIAVNTGPLPDKVLSDAGASVVFPSMAALAENIETFFNRL
ncbi:MAG: HAD-IA family hydrolase [Dysgonamonadaceae bacterium]|jgi:HAD superfamily hydrolase (TIGR01509 family)|nr:HAD-IA family hydrolase [Dysgonamonadaceae bacterium]